LNQRNYSKMICRSYSPKIKAQSIRNKAIISNVKVRQPLQILLRFFFFFFLIITHTHTHTCTSLYFILLICDQELESVKQCNRLRFRWQKEVLLLSNHSRGLQLNPHKPRRNFLKATDREFARVPFSLLLFDKKPDILHS